MTTYRVTGPGFIEYIKAISYSQAIAQIAMLRRVNPILLCVEKA